MRKNYFYLWLTVSIFLVIFVPVISSQNVNALGTSTLTINTQDLNGVPITGIYIQLFTNGKQIASGSSPVTFVVNNTQVYTVEPNNYFTYMFDHWLDTGSTNSARDISISSDTTITAVYKTATSPTNVTPQSPTGLEATAVSSSQINLSWTAPSNNGGSAITGYKIERSTDGGTTWSTIVSNTGNTNTAYSDIGLNPSTTYTYRVSAINSVGTGSPSSTASATTQSLQDTVPQPPTSLEATAISSSQINLSWTAPSNNGGSAIIGYEVEQSRGDLSFSGFSNSTSDTFFSVPNATKFSDTALDASTTYNYTVFAKNSVGSSLPSSTASATTQSSTCTTCELTITTQLTTGSPITGIYVELDQNGQKISSGYSPVTFALNNGVQYTVAITNYGTYVFDHWNDTNSTANPRPISISNNSTITAIYRDTAVTLSPSQGPTGTTVSVAGTTFSPIHTITLTWDGTTLATNPPIVTSGSTGSFSATFKVPSTASNGSHKVTATDGTNTHSALFTVGPAQTLSISLNTNSVNVGTDVRVTGTNFAPSSQITLSYDGAAIGVGTQDIGSGSTIPLTITTDSSGNFVAIMQVLRSVAGTHTISAQDASKNTASQSVTVSPHVVIFPTTGKAGSSVLIPASQGNGFAANSTVTIKFDGTIIIPSSVITTDSTGNFGESFTVPSTAVSGSHTITISDVIGNTFSTSFTVDPNAHTYSVQVLASGLNFPSYFAFIPDNGPGVDGSGAFMVNEKNTGNVTVFKNVNGQFVKQPVPFVTVPNIQVNYETNGLLGIAFDPNWATSSSSQYVYLYVTRNQTVNGIPTDAIIGEVIRYHATTDSSGNIIADQSVGEQLVLGNIPAFENGHNGGSLKFDSQGNLYISTGDGWQFIVSQNLTTLQGKILRITPLASPVNGQLYSIPSSNPFASNTNSSIKKEIWGYGVRNPYAFDIDSKTGKVYASDTGFNTWERIENFTVGGSNAGWPNYEAPPFGNPQNLASYTPYLYWYPHQGVEPQTGPSAGLEALSAGAFYHGTAYPNLDGAYFFGDYGVGNIAALEPSSVAPPTTDPASGYPIGQTVPILYGLTFAPIYMEEWNGKLYFMDLNGNVNVLNYN